MKTCAKVGRDDPYLFVYGSLMASMRGRLGQAERRCLRWHARLFGRGTVSGSLHDMGGYPGLVRGARVCERVYGEVWRITAPRVVWRVLDVYEGLDGDPPDYVRERVMVDLGHGSRLRAWVYRPLADVTALPRFPDGRWRG